MQNLKKATNLFRVTCTYIRNTLADKGFLDTLIRELNKYKLDISIIDCDAFNFEDVANSLSQLSPEELRDAIALYKGEYFQSAPYDWALQKRTFLEIQFKEISRISARMYIDKGNLVRACETLAGILALDPYDYNTAVEYVKLKIKSGDSDGALHFYREFTDRLLRETGDFLPEILSDMLKEN